MLNKIFFIVSFKVSSFILENTDKFLKLTSTFNSYQQSQFIVFLWGTLRHADQFIIIFRDSHNFFPLLKGSLKISCKTTFYLVLMSSLQSHVGLNASYYTHLLYISWKLMSLWFLPLTKAQLSPCQDRKKETWKIRCNRCADTLSRKLSPSVGIVALLTSHTVPIPAPFTFVTCEWMDYSVFNGLWRLGWKNSKGLLHKRTQD